MELLFFNLYYETIILVFITNIKLKIFTYRLYMDLIRVFVGVVSNLNTDCFEMIEFALIS